MRECEKRSSPRPQMLFDMLDERIRRWPGAGPATGRVLPVRDGRNGHQNHGAADRSLSALHLALPSRTLSLPSNMLMLCPGSHAPSRGAGRRMAGGETAASLSPMASRRSGPRSGESLPVRDADRAAGGRRRSGGRLGTQIGRPARDADRAAGDAGDPGTRFAERRFGIRL